VTRIVAGAAKGRRLAVPPAGTRPTSERAREALFNSLGALVELDGARVLDLFAGSGAVGLEALSRGAASATFVESDRRAGDVLRRNIDAVALPGAVLLRRPVAVVLSAPPEPPEPRFELVFADPPYALADEPLASVLRQLAAGWLAAGALVVVERAARGTPPPWPDGVIPVMNRRYGEGVLWYGRRQ
jgi:16S rRNA (guanine966-N2)-methyltransferase